MTLTNADILDILDQAYYKGPSPECLSAYRTDERHPEYLGPDIHWYLTLEKVMKDKTGSFPYET